MENGSKCEYPGRKQGWLTYQFFIVKCAGGHSRSDACFSRVLDKRLQKKNKYVGLKIKLGANVGICYGVNIFICFLIYDMN